MAVSSLKNSDLAKIARRWQKRLRLDDWRITVKWATQEELRAFFAEDEDEPDPDKMAAQAVAATDDFGPHAWNTSATENREATILLKQGAFDSERDIEAAIVHEELHIVLAWLTPPSSDRYGQIHLEQTIIALEGALMEGIE